MIPRHRPPFGLLSLAVSTGIGLLKNRSIADVENTYRRWLNAEHAIWLPSARFGITHAIRCHPERLSRVYCPAFNCGAVFHAAYETSCDVRFVDTAPKSLLVDSTVPAEQSSAVILSEMFGQRFTPENLSKPLASAASQRIFDMAMGIPQEADLLRMRDHDVSVLSFGLGKSLYAGWGGLALTQSSEMAGRLRQVRDRAITQSSRTSRIKWNAKVLARTAAHCPAVYGPLRSLRSQHTAESTLTEFSNTSSEWLRNATSLHSYLAIQNATQAESWADRRRRLCQHYRECLSEVMPSGFLQSETSDALSHFCIRLPDIDRPKFCRHLWNSGVDVGRLFPFPQDLVRAVDFPNAARAAAEIVNLPLSNQLSIDQVSAICEVVKGAAKKIGRTNDGAARIAA